MNSALKLVVFCCVIGFQFASGAITWNAYWTMDKLSDGNIVPDEDGGDEWEQLSADNLVDGWQGSALFIDTEINLAENIRSTCLHTLDLCAGGLSLVFWLRVDTWGSNQEKQVIWRTMNSGRELPGIYLGGINENTLEAFFWNGNEGKQYRASFEIELGSWYFTAITWNDEVGIQIGLNGNFLGVDQYVAQPSITTVDSARPPLTDFALGNIVGPHFLLDNVGIVFDTVTAAEFVELYVGEFPATTTAGLETATLTMEPVTSPKAPESTMIVMPETSTPPEVSVETTTKLLTTVPEMTTLIYETVETPKVETTSEPWATETDTTTTTSPTPEGCPTTEPVLGDCSVSSCGMKRALDEYNEKMAEWKESWKEYKQSEENCGLN